MAKTTVTISKQGGPEVDVTKQFHELALVDKVMQRAQADVSGLVEEHIARIWACMKNTQEEAETRGDEKAPVYKVGLTISLVPIGQHVVNVSAAISYGTKIKDETVDSNISDHPELPLDK